MMEREWRAVLERYGQKVTVCGEMGGPSVKTRAFLQSVPDKREDQRIPTPLGLRREDRFLYLGPPDVPLKDGDMVEWEGQSYLVQSAHPVGAGQINHWWGLLRPRNQGGRP